MGEDDDGGDSAGRRRGEIVQRFGQTTTAKKDEEDEGGVLADSRGWGDGRCLLVVCTGLLSFSVRPLNGDKRVSPRYRFFFVTLPLLCSSPADGWQIKRSLTRYLRLLDAVVIKCDVRLICFVRTNAWITAPYLVGFP